MKIVVAAVFGALAYFAVLAPPSHAAENSGPAVGEVGAKLLNAAIIEPKGAGLVFFRAGWCGPCGRMAPNLASAAHNADLQIVEIDVTANPVLADSYNVHDIPAVLLFSKGALIDRKVGIMAEKEIATWLRQNRRSP